MLHSRHLLTFKAGPCCACAAFERLHNWAGTVWTARIGILGLIPGAMLSALPSLFATHPIWVQVSLFSAMATNAVADTAAYVACSILVR